MSELLMPQERLPKGLLSFLWHFIKKQKYLFIFVVIFSAAKAISDSIWPYLVGNLITVMENSLQYGMQDYKNALYITLGFWVFVEVMSRARGISFAFFMPRFEAEMRNSVFNFMHKHSHAYFTRNFSGSLASRISSLPQASSMILDIVLTEFVPLTLALLISASLFLNLDWRLSAILLLWLTSHVLLALHFFIKATELSRKQSKSLNEVMAGFVDTINNHLNIKLFASSKHENKHFRMLQDQERHFYHQTLIYIEKVSVLLSILSIIAVTSLIFLSSYLWNKEVISIGSMVFVIHTAINLVEQLWVVTDEMTYFFRDLGNMKQSLTLLQEEYELKETQNAKDLNIQGGKIEFRNVSFQYKHQKALFENKNTIIHSGEKIGLVGFSGCGKTTFARLIMRLYDVTKGQILIDNQDIKTVTLDSLRRNIAHIPQSPTLFHRTIRENIIYPNSNITETEMIEAAKAAQCHDFISDLPMGYDTIVGEMGGKLSGGQKQLLVIARTMLKNSNIILIDEATSALDNFTEKQVQKAIQHLTHNKTSLIIAHRLSTLLDVDKIIVFNKGEIVETGTHASLLEKGGHYSLLWSLERDGFLPDYQDFKQPKKDNSVF